MKASSPAAATGAADLSSAITRLKTGAATVNAGVTNLKTVTAIVNAAMISVDAATMKGAMETVIADTGGLTAWQVLYQSTQGIGDSEAMPKIASTLATIDAPAQGFAAGIAKLDADLTSANSGAASLAAGAAKLAGGTTSLTEGAASLANGTSALSNGAASLSEGTSTLATGAASLADGASTLSGGLGSLSEGSQKITAGSQELPSVIARRRATAQLVRAKESGPRAVPADRLPLTTQSSVPRLRHLMPALMKPSRSPSNTVAGLPTS
jgi:X-X-X-Leu-X-X-Gly heptad repeat protein